MKEHEVVRIYITHADFVGSGCFFWSQLKEQEVLSGLKKAITSLPTVLRSFVPLILAGQVEFEVGKQCDPDDQNIYFAVILREIGGTVNRNEIIGLIKDTRKWFGDALRECDVINAKDDPDRIKVVSRGTGTNPDLSTIALEGPVSALVNVLRDASKGELTVELGKDHQVTVQKSCGAKLSKEDEAVVSDMEGQVVGVLQLNSLVLLYIKGKRKIVRLSYPQEMRLKLLEAQTDGRRMQMRWRETFRWSNGVKKVTGGVLFYAERVPELDY